jgi:hypothetical protein
MRVIIERPELEPYIGPGVRRWSPTIRYLSQTEVHVYALAISASVLLSFFPFLIVMITPCATISPPTWRRSWSTTSPR